MLYECLKKWKNSIKYSERILNTHGIIMFLKNCRPPLQDIQSLSGSFQNCAILEILAPSRFNPITPKDPYFDVFSYLFCG